ncbi:MAG: hypothetical protein GEU79_12175, partial [Acidimicrobiia bacterium]|nr:hypothetical protein [Acidimicrobiia bacterium]
MNRHTDIVENDRTCIMVLGMHRSGTSALTRVLNLLGATLPGDLLEANEWNESGYWEPDKLVSLHEHMLREAGSSWNDWRPFTPEKLGEGRLEHYRNDIRKQIIEDFGDSTLFVLKDPRISRFTPLYVEILKDLGIAPHFVIMYRNPLGVIASLSQRDQMTPGFASLMWLQHQLAAERATRGFPRTFLSYANLLDDWRGSVKRITTELGMVWPRSIESASSEIDSFISPELQHHPQQPEDLNTDTTIPQWVKDSYTALQRLEDSDPEDGDALRSLEQSHREFESQAEVFADALEENRSIVARLTEERNELVRNLAGMSSRATGAEASVNSLRLDKDHLEQAVTHNEERVQQLEEENERSTAREYELSDRVAELTNAVSDLTNEKSRLTDDVADFRSETDRLISRISELEDQKLKLHEYGGQLVTQRRDLEAEVLALKKSTTPESATPIDDTPNIETLPGLVDLTPTQRAEIRDAFDDDFYLKRYLDVAASGIDPFEHFMRYGWSEGRNPVPDFSPNYYRSWAPDLAPDVNPFIHWITKGRHDDAYTTLPGMRDLTQEQQVEVRDAFDRDFYLKEYPQIQEAGIDPFEHFMRHGWREGRNPRPYFSTTYYRSWAPDLEPDVNPFIHWITYGRHQPHIANLPGTEDL